MAIYGNVNVQGLDKTIYLLPSYCKDCFIHETMITPSTFFSYLYRDGIAYRENRDGRQIEIVSAPGIVIGASRKRKDNAEHTATLMEVSINRETLPSRCQIETVSAVLHALAFLAAVDRDCEVMQKKTIQDLARETSYLLRNYLQPNYGPLLINRLTAHCTACLFMGIVVVILNPAGAVTFGLIATSLIIAALSGMISGSTHALLSCAQQMKRTREQLDTAIKDINNLETQLPEASHCTSLSTHKLEVPVRMLTKNNGLFYTNKTHEPIDLTQQNAKNFSFKPGLNWSNTR
jgi:hypothetical protein